MLGINRKFGYAALSLVLLFVMAGQGVRAKAAETKEAVQEATLQQTTKDVEMKESPDDGSSTLGKLDEGTAVIVEETGKSWSKISYRGAEGYIPTAALESYGAEEMEYLAQEFQEVGEGNRRIVDEYELAQKEKRSSAIWGAAAAVMVAGIFATGIYSALKKNKEGKRQ